jgi:hypothetical protein
MNKQAHGLCHALRHPVRQGLPPVPSPASSSAQHGLRPGQARDLEHSTAATLHEPVSPGWLCLFCVPWFCVQVDLLMSERKEAKEAVQAQGDAFKAAQVRGQLPGGRGLAGW